jgi:HK97 family phage portal protein
VETRKTTLDIDRFVTELQSRMGLASQTQGGLSPADQVNSLVGWVYVCVDRIRSAFAQVPLRVKERNRDGSEPETITDPDHPVVRLFDNPNPYDTQFDFWGYTTTYELLVGTSYWLKTRGKNGGEPRELWPLPSQYMQPWFNDAGTILLGYTMLVNGRKLDIPVSELLVNKNINPGNRFVGHSSLAAAYEAIKSKDATRAARLKALNNDILASKFFSTDQRMSDDEWSRTTVMLQGRHGGPDRAGIPVVLTNGLKPVDLNVSAELPFRESDKDNRDEILGAFGVPPLLAGVVENANNSNTASQERVFAMVTIRPRCIGTQQRLNKDLIKDFGDKSLFVEFDNPVPDDKLQESTIDGRDVALGVLTLNERRAKLGLPPEPWGDKPRWMTEAQLIGQAASQGPEFLLPPPKDEKPAKVDELDEEGDDDEPGDEQRNKSDVQAGGPSSERKRLGRRQPAMQRKAYLQTLSRSIAKDYDKLESNTIPHIRKYFANQTKRIKARVAAMYANLPNEEPERMFETVRQSFCFVDRANDRAARLYVDGTIVEEQGQGDTGRLGRCVELMGSCLDRVTVREIEVRKLAGGAEEALDDWERAAEELAGRMLPRIREALAGGGETQLDELDIGGALDLDAPRVRDWLLQKQRDYWRDTVNDTTKRILSERLSDVLADRPTLPKMIEVVEEVMGSRIASSAENIARTEIVGAYNAGANIVRKETGVEKKEWVATFDGRTRPAHADADGQVVRQDGQFEVGGELMDHPGDPRASTSNICQCRCACVAVLDDDS